MRTLDRYIFKEISTSWAAVTVVLLVIMVANVLARILSKVTDGSLPADALFLLVGIKVINLLVTLIPLGLYLGVLLAFGRLYRDSEMSAIAACGTGLGALYRPALLTGVIGMLLITLLTFLAIPWAARYEQQLTEKIATQSVGSVLDAGRFVEILNDEETDEEFIFFVNGFSTIAKPGADSYQQTKFARHGVRLPRGEQSSKALENSAKSLSELVSSDDLQSKAELQWRFSIPFAALLLALLAIPLAYTSPRQGRYSKIAIAILIYLPYANMLVLSRKWIAAGTIPPWVGLNWVHMLVIVLIFILTVRRYGTSWLIGARTSVSAA